MPYIILPDKWTKRPDYFVEIDWANTITDRLVFDDFGLNVNLARANTAPSGASYPSDYGSSIGIASDFDGTGNYVDYPAPVTAAPLTLMVWFAVDQQARRTPICLTNSAATNSIFEIRLEVSGTPAARTVQGVSVGSATAPSSLTVGRIHQLTAVFASSSSRYMWVDGVAGSENTTSATPASINTLGIGRLSTSSPTQYADGKMGPRRVWNRALSGDEIRSLLENPWQTYQRDLGRVYFIPATGGQTISPGVGNISVTGYAPVVSQPRTLALQAGHAAITGRAPTVSQPRAIATAVGHVSVTGYAPTVRQDASRTITLDAGHVVITGRAPTVSQPRTLGLSAGHVVYSGYAPAVRQGEPQDIAFGAGHVAISGYAPTVLQPRSVGLETGHITYTGRAPTLQQVPVGLIELVSGHIAYSGYAPDVISALLSVRAIITRGSSLIGQYGEIIERVTTASILRADAPDDIFGQAAQAIFDNSDIATDGVITNAIQPGQVFTAGSESWRVERIESDDGYKTRVILR